MEWIANLENGDLIFEYSTKWVDTNTGQIILVPDSLYSEMQDFADTVDYIIQQD